MKIAILGAGAGGLATAQRLKRQFDDIQVHEAADVPGGLARSFKWHGFDCDLAPHRLYTNDEALLKEILAMVPCEKIRRRSRIFIQGRWIQDPVNAFEMVMKFLPLRSLYLVWTFLFRRRHPGDNFESLVLSKFGRGLNEMFFKPYSEKLFGIPAHAISAAWGHRKLRVGGVKDFVRRNSKLYFKYFYYPKENGYGALCDRLYRDVEGVVRLNSRLTKIEPVGTGGYRCEFDQGGRQVVEHYDYVISSLPVAGMAKMLGCPTSLKFRPARLTYLLIAKPLVSDQHWFYFADKNFVINRVAEFKNFARGPVPADKTVLCCEVTDVQNWSLARVVSELEKVGLIAASDVLDSKIVDINHAYPIYDCSYETQMAKLADFAAGHPNLFHIGRHAQFDHQDVDEIFASAARLAATVVERAKLEGRLFSDAAKPARAPQSVAPVRGAARETFAASAPSAAASE